MTNYVAQAYWCPQCGKAVWAVPEYINDPRQLLCDDCREVFREREEEEETPYRGDYKASS